MGEAESSGPLARRLTISVGSMVYAPAENDVFTFGRDAGNTHCLDPDDLGISRVAGAVTARYEHWWIINRSGTNPLTIIESGLRETLLAGRSRALAGPVTVWVAGLGRSHSLQVDVSDPFGGRHPEFPAPTSGMTTWRAPELSPRDREVCELLFEPMFRADGRSDPIPAKYVTVARRLGLPESTVRRRVENLRARLTRMGVVNLDGRTALTNLGEYLISRRLIGPGRLERLDQP